MKRTIQWCMALIGAFICSLGWAALPTPDYKIDFESLNLGDISSTDLASTKGVAFTNNGSPQYKVEQYTTTTGKTMKGVHRSTGAQIGYLSPVDAKGQSISMNNSSIAFWVKPSENNWRDSIGVDWTKASDSVTLASIYAVWERRASDNNGAVYWFPASIASGMQPSTSDNPGFAVVEGKLNHWVVVCNEGKMTYYLNGGKIEEKDVSETISFANYNYLSVGLGGSATRNDNTYWNNTGAVAEVRVYATVLSNDDVYNLYHGIEGDITEHTYDLTSEGAATALSGITDFATGASEIATIVLPSGATFTIDGTPQLAELVVQSEGAVTIAATPASLANISIFDVTDVTGTATLEWMVGESDTNVIMPNTNGFDVVKKLGAGTYSTTTERFADKQLIVAGGTVTLDADLSQTTATAEKPMTVTGAGVELKLIGKSHNYNRAPNSGTILAQEGATLAIEGVNLFSGTPANRPNIKVDGATFRVDNYSGAHMKVKTVTLANDSSIQIAGAQAYDTQGLVIQGGDETKLAVMSGTDNKIEYAQNAHHNKLVIDGGVIDVAESAKLTLDVVLDQAIVKNGEGELELSQSRMQNATVNAGTLHVTGVTGTLSQGISGNGTLKITATGDVTLSSAPAKLAITTANAITLGETRPTITELADGATLTITPTADELIAGKVVLPTEGVTLSTTNLTVTDDANFTIDTDGSIKLSTSMPTWSNGTWSADPASGDNVLIDFGDTSDAICTWNHDEAIALNTVVVKGSGIIDLTGNGAITLDNLELPADTSKSVTMKTVANLTVTGAISGSAALTWASGRLIQTKDSLLASTYVGAVVLNSGTWQWGSSGAAESTLFSVPVTYASSVTVNTGATLELRAWTGNQVNKDKGNKVQFLPPVTLNGGHIYTNDGSYYFAKVTVQKPSTFKIEYDKGIVIERLLGSGDLTVTGGSYDNNNSGLYVWWTKQDNNPTYTGVITVNGDTSPANKMVFHTDTSDAFSQAKIIANAGVKLELTGDRTYGALEGAAEVAGNKILTIGGYAGETTGVFNGTIGNTTLLKLASNTQWSLNGILGTVTTTGEVTTGSYTSSITLENGSQLTLALAHPTTLSGVISGAGTLQVASDLKLTGANTYSGGTTVAADVTVTADHNSAFGTGAVSGEGGNVTIDETVNLAGDITATGMLTFTGGHGLYGTGAVNGPSIVLVPYCVLGHSSEGKVTVTIAKDKTITGGGTVNADVTFAADAILDTRGTTPIYNGTVTFAGAIVAKVTRAQVDGSDIITKTGLTAPAATIYVDEATEKDSTLLLKATDTGLAVVKAEVMVNGVPVETLEKAVADAKSDDTVTILKDGLTLPETLPEGVTFVLGDDVEAPTAPDGYKWNDEGTLVTVTYVAQIGDDGAKYEDLATAIANAGDATVKLLADIETDVEIAAGQNVTIAANGKTITGKVTVNGTLAINTAITNIAGTGTLTYTSEYGENEGKKDLSIPADLTVVMESASGFVWPNAQNEPSTITVSEGATLELKSGMSYVSVTGDGLTKVTGTYTFGVSGTFANALTTPVEIMADSVLQFRGRQSYAFTSPALTVNGTLKNEGYNGATAATLTIGATTTLTGTGTIELATTFADGATLDKTVESFPTLTGNVTFAGALTVKVAEVTDEAILSTTGTMEDAPTTATIIVDGEDKTSAYELKVENNALYIVDALADVAEVNGVQYKSLRDAVDAGGMVTLLADVELTAFVRITKDVTLDLNGKTITAPSITSGGAIVIGDYNNDQKFATVTITGEGAITSGAYCVNISYGKLTIDSDATFTGVDTAVQIQRGELVIDKGTYQVTPGEGNSFGDYRYTINKLDKYATEATVIINGGKYYKFNPADNAAEGAGTNFAPAGYIGQQDADGWYTLVKAPIDTGILPTPPTEGTEADIKVAVSGETETVQIEKAAYDAIVTAANGTMVKEITVAPVVDGGIAPTAQAAVDAAALIADVVTVDTDGKATISYAFGITAIDVVDRTATAPQLKITVKAQKPAAEQAQDGTVMMTDLAMLAIPQLIEEGTTNVVATANEQTEGATTYTFTVSLADLYKDGVPKKLDVKLSK